MHNHIFSREILLANYTLLRKDHESRGGGVLEAFSDTLSIKQLPSPSNLEVITAEVDSSFVLCLIYRPPNVDNQYNSSLLSYLSSFDPIKNIPIIGELNLPDVDWNTFSGSSDQFTDIFFDLNLTQHVSGPTHHAGNTLDIFLTNFDGVHHVDTLDSLPPNLCSDHHMTIVTFEHTTTNHTNSSTTFRMDYNHAD